MTRHIWIDEEIKILKDNYRKISQKELELLLPNRTWKYIKDKAYHLGLTKKRQEYSELKFLEAIKTSSSYNEAMGKLGYKTPCHLSGCAKFLKLVKKLKPNISHFSLQSRCRFDKISGSIESFYNVYKKSAKDRNMKFSISLEEFGLLVKQKCYYCGINGDTCVANQSQKERYCGLDRLLNNKDYTIDNIVPCCKSCNFFKKSLDEKDFLSKIHKIYKYFFETKK